LTVYLTVTNGEECWRFYKQDADEKDDIVVLGNAVVANILKSEIITEEFE
jgi:hypothetical protein